jgi:PAS domain S-box-containing protein
LLYNDPESKPVNSSDDMTQRGLCLAPEPPMPLDHALVGTTHLEPQLARIEPEMQNLSAAQVSRAEARDRYADLFEFAHVGYLTLSEQGKIVVVNFAAAEQLGAERATLIGSSFANYVAADDAQRWHLYLASTLNQDEKQECELSLASKNGSVSYIRADSRRSIKDGQAPTVQMVLTDITERKRTEEQLRFQSTLLNTVGQAVIATDLEGNITYMNAAAESTYGWSAAIAVGRSILEITVPKVSQTQALEIMGQLTQGQPWSGEFAVQHRSGKIFVAEVHNTPVLDPAGKLIGIIGVSSDISLRKQSEQSLAQSEERYRTLFKSIDEGFCLIEMIYDEYQNPIDWRYLEVNPVFERQAGLHDTVGKRIRELAPDLEPSWFKIYGDVARTGEPIRLQNEVKALGERWFDLYAFRIGEHGSHKVAVLFKDITENKKVQDMSQATSQYARSLIEASLDPLVTISADGKITDVNEASVNATGVPRAQLIGTDFCDYFTNPEQARIGYRKVFSEGFVRDYPLAIRHASGQIIDVLYNASVYKDDEGNVLGVFAAARDVTERNRLDQVLQDKNIELQSATIVAEAANFAKSNFLSSMSHEIRTPLNAVLGFAQLIEIGSPPPTISQMQSLNQILKGGWYLLELINEILDLAQIESGKASLSREAVSLAEVLLECREMISPQATQRGIGMDFPSLATAWFVHADRMRVKQVLLNLLSNAIKYNKPGGTVFVTTEQIPGPTTALRINVSDSGEGLSPEQLAQLFQPFNRLGREAGLEEGTGIGLVVTKRLVELMGGRIGVESVAGAGSTFWIELALTGAPQLAMDEIEFTALLRANIAPEAMTRKVLYVEDNPANLALIEQLVTARADLRLLTAVNGYSGVELARAHLPQVILMDINLPGMSGLDAMRILRADPATAHIPIIAISANAMPRDIKSCLDAGFFDYLTKPIKLHLFLDTLNMALDFAKMGAVSGTGKSDG